MTGSSQDFDELLAVAALAKIDGIGPADIKLLLDHFKKGTLVFRGERAVIAGLLSRKKFPAATAEAILRFREFKAVADELKKARKMKLGFLTYGSDDYPENLKTLPDPPPILYVRGALTLNDQLAIGIVGTRKPTPYGRQVTARMAGALAAGGVTIVSGLASGIDSEAHRAALGVNGRTIAVTGTGQDQVYPAINKRLAGEIAERGAVVTEYPLGEKALPWHFRARNRIIAGLSLGVLVTEAPRKSGALITSAFALDYNRAVYSIPGNINSPNSEGCNMLISDGAVPVLSPERILEDLHVEMGNRPVEPSTPINPRYAEILETLKPDGQIPEIIIMKTGYPPERVSGILLEMELLGLIRRLPGNIYVHCK